MIALALHPADPTLDAPLRLDSLHLEAIRLGASAATLLGMASARDAAAAGHELWTAALLVHEVADNPLWQAGRARRLPLTPRSPPRAGSPTPRSPSSPPIHRP